MGGKAKKETDERRHVNNQSRIVMTTGRDPRNGYCAAVAVAQALAEDPNDVRECAEWLDLVIAEYEQAPDIRWKGGTHWGCMVQSARRCGLNVIERRDANFEATKVGWTDPYYGGRYGDTRTQAYRYRQGYPTLAQWIRRNPDVDRAILRGTGHVGFMCRDEDGKAIVYGMRARKRIDYAVILD